MPPPGDMEGSTNMDMREKIRIVLWSAAAALVFAGCGSKESADGLQSGEENVAQVRGQEETGAADNQGNAGDNAVSGVAKEPSQSDLPVNIPAGQIAEQSFDVALDGWGEVMFASFEPEQHSFQKNGVWMYGDARFMRGMDIFLETLTCIIILWAVSGMSPLPRRRILMCRY